MLCHQVNLCHPGLDFYLSHFEVPALVIAHDKVIGNVGAGGGGATYRSRGMKGVVIRCLQGPSVMRCDPHERSGNAVLP